MDLTPEQRAPIDSNSEQRLILAGPGTGKSYAILGFIKDLIGDKKVNPHEILVITFTRAATKELKQKIRDMLGEDSEVPRISTLHAYALRQLMRNTANIKSLPTGFSIASDYEERYIIMEDIKRLISAKKIKDVKELFNRLSADWETLRVDATDWAVDFDHPQFIGAWHEHRSIFNYVLRSELIYQLKKAIEFDDGFQIEGPTSFVIVDEYQDFNRCDLAIIQQLMNKGARIFCAGDDDQSIYQFRYAHPDGIREFSNLIPNSTSFTLTECFRCDEAILQVADQVIRQDPRRIPKDLRSMSGDQGLVKLLRFDNQYAEARKIADLIKQFTNKGIPSGDVIILLRSDHNRVFSSVLVTELRNLGVPLNIEEGELSEWEAKEGRIFLSLIRLLQNRENDLAIRTILELTSGLGPATLMSLYEEAQKRGERFSATVRRVLGGELPAITNKQKLTTTLQGIQLALDTINDETDILSIIETLAGLIEGCPEEFVENLRKIVEVNEIKKLTNLIEYADDLLNPLKSAPDELAEGVRIMSMHQAKGLTAQIVFIVAAEDEYMPGRGSDIDEERRLFYVSLTRAKHYLFLTFCRERIDQQVFTGSQKDGESRRTLTRFLRDLPGTKHEEGEAFNLDE